jgi:hypothetical protein
VSDLLESAPFPEDLGIPAEDWHQAPLNVRLGMFILSTLGNPRILPALGRLQFQSAALNRFTLDNVEILLRANSTSRCYG